MPGRLLLFPLVLLAAAACAGEGTDGVCPAGTATGTAAGTSSAACGGTTGDGNRTSTFPQLGRTPEEEWGASGPGAFDAEAYYASFVPMGGGRYPEYAGGDAPYGPPGRELRDRSDLLALVRRQHVRDAMRHAWGGYRTYAFGRDELHPVSGTGGDPWGGMGTTLVDSLDTLWLMGMRDEFWEARDWVRDHLDHDQVGTVSLFETTIRSLGGLLAAYDLSGDRTFLDRADDLGGRLLAAFSSPSGIPYGAVNLRTGRASNLPATPRGTRLAEYATLQVEFRYLARATGRAEYARGVERIMEVVEEMQPPSGLLPISTSNLGKRARGQGSVVSLGAMGDSAYEYMLKTWLQGGRTEPRYRAMYDRAMQGLHDGGMLLRTVPSGLLFVAELHGGRVHPKMDHLTCFLGGTLALGAYTDPRGPGSARALRDLATARSLAYTCYQMYARTATGLSGEIVHLFPGGAGQDLLIRARDAHCLLRPEAVEAFYVLHHLTADPVYREWGWEIFRALQRHARTPAGYGTVGNVTDARGTPEDRMESFFLAETLKYLYLLFDPGGGGLRLLDGHVLSTEAHPLRNLGTWDAPPPRPGPGRGEGPTAPTGPWGRSRPYSQRSGRWRGRWRGRWQWRGAGRLAAPLPSSRPCWRSGGGSWTGSGPPSRRRRGRWKPWGRSWRRGGADRRRGGESRGTSTVG